MSAEPRIFCIEGSWDKNRGPGPDTTVDTAIAHLDSRGNGTWPRSIYRRCINHDSLVEALALWARQPKGSILYFAAHGTPGALWFTDDFGVRIEQLALMLVHACTDPCSGCLVHFCSCAVLADDSQVFEKFLADTKAVAVSGYVADKIGWMDYPKPSTPIEEALFAGIVEDRISLIQFSDRSRKRLLKLCDKLKGSYPDSEFEIHLRCS